MHINNEKSFERGKYLDPSANNCQAFMSVRFLTC